MPASYKRADRVKVVIQQEISLILRDMRDLSAGLVTVMGVKLTDDLLSCKIFYSVFGDEAVKNNAAMILKDNAKEIRHQLALRINLRRTPSLEFIYDNTNEAASKVFDILKKIEDEKND
ncbi:MAG: 30S ribosome-binding factor RbfA [Endomicrobium sp.]|jgi:ribosome-binding factor A|nr:30S ribosome-binding factor RbfA [Endomicrobium sp.]